MSKTAGATHTSLHTDAEIAAIEKLYEPKEPATPAEKLRFFALQTLIRSAKRPTSTAVKAAEALVRFAKDHRLVNPKESPAQGAPVSVVGARAREALKQTRAAS